MCWVPREGPGTGGALRAPPAGASSVSRSLGHMGAPDGVGGALKNLADRIVAYGTSIPDADTLFEQLNHNSSVRLFKITEEDITTSGELVPPYLKAVPGTMRIHQKGSSEKESVETVLEVGKWVLVEYDAGLFPGTITQIVNDQYEVDTMSCAGANKFYFPSVRFDGEKVWYFFHDIKSIIPEPQPATSSARHFCVLPEIWAKYSNSCRP
ncbi:unnamed protein product [Arctogadus glacialis]